MPALYIRLDQSQHGGQEGCCGVDAVVDVDVARQGRARPRPRHLCTIHPELELSAAPPRPQLGEGSSTLNRIDIDAAIEQRVLRLELVFEMLLPLDIIVHSCLYLCQCVTRTIGTDICCVVVSYIATNRQHPQPPLPPSLNLSGAN